METSLVEGLMNRLQLSPRSHILDAACGTGETALALWNEGFKNIAGIDGSRPLLKVARSIVADRIPLRYCRWEHIGPYLAHHGPFDLIFILGNSLPHVPSEVVRATMQSIFASTETVDSRP